MTDRVFAEKDQHIATLMKRVRELDSSQGSNNEPNHRYGSGSGGIA